MKIVIYIILAPALILSFTACKNNEGESARKSTLPKRAANKAVDDAVNKFSLPYPGNLALDSNSLIFYHERTFDTSSLMHLGRTASQIKGVYYEILPAYHQFVNDFADERSNLLFFEGYSFIIDSATWEKVIERAQRIVKTGDRLSKGERFMDGSKYALYYNQQASYGNSNDSALYEDFNKFLKETFLNTFVSARKPVLHKSK